MCSAWRLYCCRNFGGVLWTANDGITVSDPDRFELLLRGLLEDGGCKTRERSRLPAAMRGAREDDAG